MKMLPILAKTGKQILLLAQDNIEMSDGSGALLEESHITVHRRGAAVTITREDFHELFAWYISGQVPACDERTKEPS